MDPVIIIEVIAAALALVGMFCFVKYISDTFFLPREIVTAVTVFDSESRENADLLLHILKKGIWRQADRRIFVLLAEEYATDEGLLQLISSAGAEYCIIKEK